MIRSSIMKQFLVCVASLILFSTLQTVAQTSGPRKPPVSSNRQIPAQNGTPDVEMQDNTQTQKTAQTQSRTVNGIDIVLKRIKGNAADQSVSLEMLFTNPKGNGRVVTSRAEAFDLEGDKYIYPPGGSFIDEVLYTDVPRKTSVKVSGVPAKIKSLRLFKFVMWSEIANQEVVVEFRNLEIEW